MYKSQFFYFLIKCGCLNGSCILSSQQLGKMLYLLKCASAAISRFQSKGIQSLVNFFDLVRISLHCRVCKFFKKTGSTSANQEISSRFFIGPSRHVSQYVFIKPLPCSMREKTVINMNKCNAIYCYNSYWWKINRKKNSTHQNHPLSSKLFAMHRHTHTHIRAWIKSIFPFAYIIFSSILYIIIMFTIFVTCFDSARFLNARQNQIVISDSFTQFRFWHRRKWIQYNDIKKKRWKMLSANQYDDTWKSL